MSYADARVDLTPVGIACLTGLNGAGKSALLDAITWALWESARASSDEIVRLGQTLLRIKFIESGGQDKRLTVATAIKSARRGILTCKSGMENRRVGTIRTQFHLQTRPQTLAIALGGAACRHHQCAIRKNDCVKFSEWITRRLYRAYI